MQSKNTIEYLGLWEMLNNPDLKGVEFDPFERNRRNWTYSRRGHRKGTEHCQEKLRRILQSKKREEQHAFFAC